LQNIGVDAFNDDDKAFISASHFEGLKKHSCVPGDILIGTLGDPNLRACIQPPHIPIALNKADCVQMRCDPKRALAEYVCALLNCPSTERMAQDKIQGQTCLRISMGRLRELRVPVPPIERQFQFAEIIHEIRVSTTRQLAAQRIIDSLFSSLQHRAFTGELTSKDVERELAVAG
jgi:type I restriction enzyme S subunit